MLQKDLSIKRLIKNVLWHKMGQNILRDRATNCAIWKACEVFFFFPPITELKTHFKDWTSIVKTYLFSPIRLPVSKKDDK